VKDTPDASATEADVQANPVGIIRPTFDILDAAQRLTKLRVLIIRPQPHTRPDPRAPSCRRPASQISLFEEAGVAYEKVAS
jgi:hypothetical protein